MATTNLYAVHAGKDGDALKVAERDRRYEKGNASTHIHAFAVTLRDPKGT